MFHIGYPHRNNEFCPLTIFHGYVIIKHGWLNPRIKWRFLARKITDFYAPLSSTPCLFTGGYPLFNKQSYPKPPSLIGKSTINGLFSIAMLNYQRMYIYIYIYLSIYDSMIFYVFFWKESGKVVCCWWYSMTGKPTADLMFVALVFHRPHRWRWTLQLESQIRRAETMGCNML